MTSADLVRRVLNSDNAQLSALFVTDKPRVKMLLARLTHYLDCNHSYDQLDSMESYLKLGTSDLKNFNGTFSPVDQI
jgi:hypothetical protein